MTVAEIAALDLQRSEPIAIESNDDGLTYGTYRYVRNGFLHFYKNGWTVPAWIKIADIDAVRPYRRAAAA